MSDDIIKNVYGSGQTPTAVDEDNDIIENVYGVKQAPQQTQEVQQPKEIPEAEKTISKSAAVNAGFWDGLSFGWNDELVDWLQPDIIFGEGAGEAKRDELRKTKEEAQEQRAGHYIGGSIAGAIVPSIGTFGVGTGLAAGRGVAGAARGAFKSGDAYTKLSTTQKIGVGIGTGAADFGTYEAGSAEEGERGKAFAKGAVTGAAFGGAIPGIPAAVRGLGFGAKGVAKKTGSGFEKAFPRRAYKSNVDNVFKEIDPELYPNKDSRHVYQELEGAYKHQNYVLNDMVDESINYYAGASKKLNKQINLTKFNKSVTQRIKNLKAINSTEHSVAKLRGLLIPGNKLQAKDALLKLKNISRDKSIPDDLVQDLALSLIKGTSSKSGKNNLRIAFDEIMAYKNFTNNEFFAKAIKHNFSHPFMKKEIRRSLNAGDGFKTIDGLMKYLKSADAVVPTKDNYFVGQHFTDKPLTGKRTIDAFKRLIFAEVDENSGDILKKLHSSGQTDKLKSVLDLTGEAGKYFDEATKHVNSAVKISLNDPSSLNNIFKYSGYSSIVGGIAGFAAGPLGGLAGAGVGALVGPGRLVLDSMLTRIMLNSRNADGGLWKTLRKLLPKVKKEAEAKGGMDKVSKKLLSETAQELYAGILIITNEIKNGTFSEFGSDVVDSYTETK